MDSNFLSKIGLKLDFEAGERKWYDTVLTMQSRSGLSSIEFDDMIDQYFIQVEDELFGENWIDCFGTGILDPKYEFIDVADVVNQMNHLNQKQKMTYLPS